MKFIIKFDHNSFVLFYVILILSFQLITPIESIFKLLRKKKFLEGFLVGFLIGSEYASQKSTPKSSNHFYSAPVPRYSRMPVIYAPHYHTPNRSLTKKSDRILGPMMQKLGKQKRKNFAMISKRFKSFKIKS
ncbi:hypothetical protein SSS_07111 [Sarcoptes scabiei]|uniref:Uncharacterized protein n=1 Tax=Sarcoptes scabiei TaxID=52283 RepID=A0A834VCS3_SARSC|nr:hypothetical protein SSS_07111 [Sarcoptes scabiei]UXI15679.1 replication factor C subunit 4-like [Sarcoptes scabiei]